MGRWAPQRERPRRKLLKRSNEALRAFSFVVHTFVREHIGARTNLCSGCVATAFQGGGKDVGTCRPSIHAMQCSGHLLVLKGDMLVLAQVAFCLLLRRWRCDCSHAT
ncbi:unnamed protein product [Ostreobium quekettii]|uniref:Uncharacterized protein n=1 Tax=Ostreobium quekettii TaxID=121088 RepID=A0A8S1J1G8_9CHLO|nr:unnamed protein product [Ostreobium quekettii]|eukprot:evm.model.scf_1774.3 EVM.evm.TU.scf_1774.3   scf_1774:14797-16609(+)